MTTSFSIQQIAKLFGINASRLRYWEKKGLLNPRRDANGYRCYSPKDISLITDIINYEAANLSISDLQHLNHYHPEELQNTFDNAQQKLSQQIAELHYRQASLNYQQQKLNELLRLKRHPYRLTNIPFTAASNFDELNSEILQKRVYEHADFIFIQSLSAKQEPIQGIIGLTKHSNDSTTLIWQAPKPTGWYEFLLQTEYSHPMENNLTLHLQKLSQKGIHIHQIVGKFLLAARNENEQLVDYYHAYAYPK